MSAAAEHIHVRQLDPIRDGPGLKGLWTTALSPEWPLLPRGLAIARTGYVAEAGGQMVGMVAVDDLGSIPLVMIHPHWHRHGIGRRLVEMARQHLQAAGLPAITLGSGGDRCIWQGVPQNLPAAVAFFERTGWPFQRVSVDLVRDLRDYRTPLDVWKRVEPLTLAIDEVPAGSHEAVVAFEGRHFPQWSRSFRKPGAQILTAATADEGIVASLLLEGPGSASVYEPMLGQDMGTIGCVGVAEAHRGSGIGTALVARANELLQHRGVRRCHIGWTERERFYNRLGYRRWRTFRMSRRPLE